MSDTTAPMPEPADLDEFNLDDFLDGITTPTKTVPICKDRVLAQRMLEAEHRIEDLEQEEAARRAEGKKSTRRAASAESPEIEAARAELTALEEQARGSFFYIRVEPMSRTIRKQAQRAASKAASGSEIEAYNHEALAHTAQLFTSDPREDDDAKGRVLTVEEWERLTARIGVGQYDELINASQEVSLVSVSPDFSRPASPSTDGDTPSSS